jgi:NAD(P)-dependent dehydrogenase (short-subunit alcohol dehydrogenase family)
VLVNVAGGLSVIKTLADTETEAWRRELQRNAETALVVTRAALPMLREARGAVINFASPAGLRAQPQLGAYSAAKAAVIALTRVLAIEEKDHGVRANAVAPGMIDTEQNRKSVADPGSVKWVSREQIADVVLFLASDASSGITGETIHVLGEGIG